MIETIAHLLKDANAKQMQLTIRINDSGDATIIANTILNPPSTSESAKALQLRGALSSPILVTGDIGQLDVEFSQSLTQYADTFVSAVNHHSTLIDAKAVIEKAQKETYSTNQRSTTNKAEAKKEQVNEKTISTPDISQFESDEADSL
ncbi:hypothetical protein [Thalassotalea piscium]|uniref:PRTRC system protein E n=1 Tax=Thalassotalea piscium TaxID=1230533 RepID=A0A7X0NGP8_9GAMM|nr:hypothetical protein [Thalassotalea piscium]MBB6543147.1 hypothetical protein [Thalassotalea piscium]